MENNIKVAISDNQKSEPSVDGVKQNTQENNKNHGKTFVSVCPLDGTDEALVISFTTTPVIEKAKRVLRNAKFEKIVAAAIDEADIDNLDVKKSKCLDDCGIIMTPAFIEALQDVAEDEAKHFGHINCVKGFVLQFLTTNSYFKEFDFDTMLCDKKNLANLCYAERSGAFHD